MPKLFDPVDPSEIPVVEDDQSDTADYMNALVGDGKKYKDVNALAKSRIDADAHIARIEAENRKLKAEVETRMGIETFWQKTQENQNKNAASNQGQDHVQGEQAGSTKQLSQEDIMSLVERAINDKSSKLSRDQNITVARQELVKKFGTSMDTVVVKKAADLGVSTEFLQDLAAKSPKALLSLFEQDQPAKKEDLTSFSPLSGNRNIQAAGDSGSKGLRNEAYYDNLRKSNPKLYWNSSTQFQMHKDAQALGDKFFN